ncbi:hypothetical protein HPB47_009023 [Ixodes persulcatus]|uniref:Uncharacterized protein n=1 Tax=Ixodes persulcatus TaxID=34615 RepID=A0AC60P3A8_IXOPE|nr:hypothetical protein HPB47_009023 [Ixodes persulcatus]
MYPEKRDAWVAAVRRAHPDGSLWEPSGDCQICSAHFITGRPSNFKDRPDFVPTVFNYPRAPGEAAVQSHDLFVERQEALRSLDRLNRKANRWRQRSKPLNPVSPGANSPTHQHSDGQPGTPPLQNATTVELLMNGNLERLRQVGDSPEQIVTRFRSVETRKKVAEGSILNSLSGARETSNGR